MKEKIIDSIALFVTACLFGSVGYWVGALVALATNGVLWLVGSSHSLELLKSGYVVFLATFLVTVIFIINDKGGK